MKVLNIVWGFSGGGVEEAVKNYHQAEGNFYIEMEYICIYRKDWPVNHKFLDDAGAKKIEFKNRFDFSWIPRLRKYLSDRDFEIVIAHGFNAPIAAFLALGWRLNKSFPFLCTYHGSYDPPTYVKKLLAPIINYFLYYIYSRHSTSILAVADHSKKFLVNKGVNSNRIIVIKNGIMRYKGASQADARLKLGIFGNHFVVGTIARLAPEKGIEYLVECARNLKDEMNDIVIYIIGGGPLLNSLQRLAKDLGVENSVIFAGSISNAYEYLAAFDLFVLSSLSENHSIALLEAMRAGLPIIATDISGNAESITNRFDGLLIPAGDPKSLCTSIKYLKSNSVSRNSLSINAHSTFTQKFTLEHMIEKYSAWIFESSRQL